MGAIALILPLYTISLGLSITISSVRLKFNTNGPVNVFEICPKSVIFTNIKKQSVATVLIASSLFLIQYPSKRELSPLLRTFLLSSSFYITHKSESKIIVGCAGFILKCKDWLKWLKYLYVPEKGKDSKSYQSHCIKKKILRNKSKPLQLKNLHCWGTSVIHNFALSPHWRQRGYKIKCLLNFLIVSASWL